MEWTRYEMRIVDVYKVALAGWPENIPFTSELSSTSLDAVLAALLDGTCKWKKLSESEYDEHVQKRLKTISKGSDPVDVEHPRASTCSDESSTDSTTSDDDGTPGHSLFMPPSIHTTDIESLRLESHVFDVGNISNVGVMENYSVYGNPSVF